jgi:hypothetical protein
MAVGLSPAAMWRCAEWRGVVELGAGLVSCSSPADTAFLRCKKADFGGFCDETPGKGSGSAPNVVHFQWRPGRIRALLPALVRTSTAARWCLWWNANITERSLFKAPEPGLETSLHT